MDNIEISQKNSTITINIENENNLIPSSEINNNKTNKDINSPIIEKDTINNYIKNSNKMNMNDPNSIMNNNNLSHEKTVNAELSNNLIQNETQDNPTINTENSSKKKENESDIPLNPLVKSQIPKDSSSSTITTSDDIEEDGLQTTLPILPKSNDKAMASKNNIKQDSTSSNAKIAKNSLSNSQSMKNKDDKSMNDENAMVNDTTTTTDDSTSDEKFNSLITQVEENNVSTEKNNNSELKRASMKKLKKIENNTIFPGDNKDLTEVDITATQNNKTKIKKSAVNTTAARTSSSARIPPPPKNNSFFKSLFLSCFSCWACKNSSVVDNVKIAPKTSSSIELNSLTSPVFTPITSSKKMQKKISNAELQKEKVENEKSKWLLKPQIQEDIGKKTLVLDLDETLVHSSFKPIAQPDYIIPVQIENQIHHVYVLKRPGVDEFLKKMGEIYEIVIFTASVGKYADPVLDTLDKYKVVRHRLFREACIHYKGNYVKDLSQLGRNLKHVIILDNSPASYIFHPTNAIPVTSWFNDKDDTELFELIPFLTDLKKVDNVTLVLDNNNDI